MKTLERCRLSRRPLSQDRSQSSKRFLRLLHLFWPFIPNLTDLNYVEGFHKTDQECKTGIKTVTMCLKDKNRGSSKKQFSCVLTGISNKRHVYVCKFPIRGTVTQLDEITKDPVMECFSKRPSPPEKNYTGNEWEPLNLVKFFDELKWYLGSSTFEIIIDNYVLKNFQQNQRWSQVHGKAGKFKNFPNIF